ncbi:MAG: prepilin-type N-terminal cleavage/methylation domain-containing protein [Planctomycetota bacterium]
MQKKQTSPRSGFTLIELLVVVAIIALLISILLPALGRARDQTKAMKCLSNLRTLGQGCLTYAAEENDALPGGLHPALYRNLGWDGWDGSPGLPAPPNNRFRERQLTWMLRRTFNDSSTFKNSVTDQVATCPISASVNPDSNFDRFYSITGNTVYPTHYVINNIGAENEQGGTLNNVRVTKPPYYFGFSAYAGASPEVVALEEKYRPQPTSKIERSAEEWMIADAWYRKRANANAPELQQEGPYQFDWSGEALPNFAPHFSRHREYSFTSSNDRDAQCATIRRGRQDGLTNAVFFDGHAVPVKSKVLTANGFELLYGFPGTVNPLKLNPNENSPVWQAYWQ